VQLIRKHPSMPGLDHEVTQATRSRLRYIPRRRQDRDVEDKERQENATTSVSIIFFKWIIIPR
jgi:hypothetical protein